MIPLSPRALEGTRHGSMALFAVMVMTGSVRGVRPVPVQPRTLTVRMDYRVEVGRNAPDSGLASIRWIAWGPSGAMLVYDGRRGRLEHFDSAGRRLPRGRLPALVSSGDASPAGAAFLNDSAFVLWEPVASRLLFGTIGDTATREKRVPLRGYVSGAGNYVFAWRDGTFGLRVISGPPPGSDHWIRYSRDGTPVDSISVPDRHHLRASDDGPRAPFSRDEVSAPLVSGGVAIGDPGRFEIRRSEGDGVFAFQRPYVPIAVVAGEAAMWRRMLSSTGTVGAGPDLPSSKPAFRRMLGDPSGRIWVDRYTVAEQVGDRGVGADSVVRWAWREPTILEAFDELTGAPVATLSIPKGHSVLHIDGSRLWALVTEGGGTWLCGMTVQ